MPEIAWAQTGVLGIFTIILGYVVWPLRTRVKEVETKCSILVERIGVMEAHYEDIKARLVRIEDKIDRANGGA